MELLDNKDDDNGNECGSDNDDTEEDNNRYAVPIMHRNQILSNTMAYILNGIVVVVVLS